MRLALVQMESRPGGVAENLRRSLRLLERARDGGADLALFPELSLSGILVPGSPPPAALDLRGPEVRRMARWARRCNVGASFGMAERSAGKPWISQVLADRRGRLIGVYRKIHVTPRGLANYRRGTGRPVFRLDDLRIGTAICADLNFPELLDSYRGRADLLLLPFAWDADPILTNGRIACWGSQEEMLRADAQGRIRRYRTHAEMLAAFRRRLAPIVRRNGFAGALVNAAGRPHPLVPYAGPSFLMAPSGRLLARSRDAREGVVFGKWEQRD